MQHILQTPLSEEVCKKLRAGDEVLLSGTIFTARDAAHARMTDMLNRGESLPIDINGASIYYAGPTPARPGEVIGSVGPTTSGRMDAYTPKLMQMGLRCIIGKGLLAAEVVNAIKSTNAVYLAAYGGAGALIAAHVKSARLICFEDLGSEAIRELTVENLPLVVAVDAQGNNLYETGPAEYLSRALPPHY